MEPFQHTLCVEYLDTQICTTLGHCAFPIVSYLVHDFVGSVHELIELELVVLPPAEALAFVDSCTVSKQA